MHYRFYCDKCNAGFDERYLSQCKSCGNNLQVSYRSYDLDYDKNSKGIWKYEKLLPVDRQFASGLLIGDTPLVNADAHFGAKVWLKEEYKNPSGSMKDRASEICVAACQQLGFSGIVVPSTGNAALSTVHISSLVNIDTIVLVPNEIPKEKLLLLSRYNTRIFMVKEGYDAAYGMAKILADNLGWLNRTTGICSFTREGKKTLAFELYEQFGGVLPDWVVVPVGDGNILSGVFKGFLDLKSAGKVNQIPRLLAVQSSSSRSISRAYQTYLANGSFSLERTYGNSIVDSISVDLPLDGIYAIHSIIQSNGSCIELSDEEIKLHWDYLCNDIGLEVDIVGGCVIGGIKKAIDSGVIQSGETVVGLLTGAKRTVSGSTQLLAKIFQVSANDDLLSYLE